LRRREDLPASIFRPREGRPASTACCFADPRIGAYWPMTSTPASESGKRPLQMGARASSSPPLRSPGTDWFSSATRTATPRAGKARMYALRRQKRQNRVGVLSRSQDRGRSVPRTTRRLAARPVDLGQHPRIPDQRRRSLVVHTRPGGRRIIRARRPPLPAYAISVREARISIPTRSPCWTP
jgi:hypothetical protein